MTDSIDEPTSAAADGSADHEVFERVHISKVIATLRDEFPDVSTSKIRFLESRGLVTPSRSESGFRRYSVEDVDRLRWVLTMQRDHFLPLRVIKDRLDAGDAGLDGDEGLDGSSEAPGFAPRTPSSRFRAPGPTSDRLAPSDMARLAGIGTDQLDALVRFGIIDPVETADGVRFEREDLRIAKAAGAFLQRGIEARHLKAWRVAAEREAGMLEQVATPIAHQQTPDAIVRAREVADELIDAGNTIREAIIVKALRDRLGSSGD